MAHRRIPLRHRKARVATAAYFYLAGFVFSSWIVYLPDIKHELHISNTFVGMILLCSGIGGLIAMFFVGRMIDRLHSRVCAFIGIVATSLALLGPALAPSTPVLMGCLLFFGLSLGCLDISMNANAVAIDAKYPRSILTSFHACYSIGSFSAAGIGSLLHFAGIPRMPGLVYIAVCAIIIGLLAFPWLTLDIAQPRGEVPVTTSSIPIPIVGDRPTTTRFATIAFIGALAALAFVVEATMVDWSPTFMVTERGTTAAVGAWALAAFNVSMTLVRMFGDKAVDRFGGKRTVRAGAIIASVGIPVAVFAPTIPLSLVGWMITGLGLAPLVPQLYRAAAVAGPYSHTGRNMSRVAGIAYSGMLLGPAYVGLVSTALPLSLTLGLLTLGTITIALGSIRLRGIG